MLNKWNFATQFAPAIPLVCPKLLDFVKTDACAWLCRISLSGQDVAHEYMEIVQQGENGCLEKNNPLICMVANEGNAVVIE